MGFRTRTLLALLAVGVVPALLMTALSWKANREELLQTVGGAQRQVASEAALGADRQLQQAVDDLRRAVDLMPFSDLSPEELSSVLQIPFRQLPSLQSIAVLDGTGNAVIPPVIRTQSDSAALSGFADHLPFSAALAKGLAVSAPWTDQPGAAPSLAVAVRIEHQADDKAPRVIAAKVSLSPLLDRLKELSAQGQYAALYDGAGTRLMDAGEGAGAEDPDVSRFVASAHGKATPQLQTVAHAGGDWLVCAAPLPALGWTLVLAQPSEVAFRSADRVARYLSYWAAIGLVLTFALGLLISRGISGPVQALSRAAEALRRGEYRIRADVRSRDELGNLATAFNAMAEEIDRRDAQIRKWNEELQQRVDQKTAELNQARDQIERSRRLEGLVSMGAGLAHELNNPLTSVIGLLTLIRDDLPADSPNAPLLELATSDAQRIAELVKRFGKVVDGEAMSAVRFDLGQAVREVLSRREAELRKAKVRFRAQLPQRVEASGDPRQLSEAIDHIVTNALEAMRDGGELNVELSQPDKGAVKLRIGDTGEGIPDEIRERVYDPFFTTRTGPGRVGLGLTLVHRVVQAHHGRVQIDSAVGKGTTVTLLLPSASTRAHLT